MSKRFAGGFFAALGIFVCILDSRTALSGALDGIQICLRRVVPSIFPFMVLSASLTSAISGSQGKILRPFGLLLGMPKGSEGIFLTGLLGGYPIGAQAVHQAWSQGHLQKDQAKRMLGFCSNAGPSFIFGILALQFSRTSLAFLLWAIHILSALAVGMILPGKSNETEKIPVGKPITLTQSLQKSVITMGFICGWIVLFRVVLAFLDRWILWIFPISVQIAIHGLLELANGCCNVSQIASESMRFVISAVMLSFGGLCVLLQTMSVTQELGIGDYLKGKIIQTGASLLLAILVQFFVFPATDRLPVSVPFLVIFSAILLLIFVIRRKSEKKSSIPQPVGV